MTNFERVKKFMETFGQEIKEKLPKENLDNLFSEAKKKILI